MVSAWTIGTAKRGFNLKSQTPGPGSYTYDKKQKKVPPAFKIGTSSRPDLLKNSNPGPGSYQIKSKLVENPKYSIGLKPEKKPIGLTPGPGNYNPHMSSSNYFSAPRYSMGLKNSISEAQLKVPGPGAYQYKSTVLGVPAPKIGTSQRESLYHKSFTPGPGSYQNVRPTSASPPSYGIGTSQRDQLYRVVQTPGPGEYKLKSEIDKNMQNQYFGSKISSRLPDQSLLEASRVPGPGAYENSFKNRRSSPQYRIGSASRDNLNSESLKIPGPGAYTPRSVNRPNSPNYKIGTQQRKGLYDNVYTPGPGTYNLPNHSIEGPKLSFKGVQGMDPVQREKSRVPGPGSYESNFYESQQHRPQSAKIGTGLRPDFLKSRNSPGPGNYNLRSDFGGPKYGFGTSTRPQSAKNNEPGPGSYCLPPMILDVPKYLKTQPGSKFPY